MSSISRQLEGVQLSKTLTLDSTSFMSGNLLDDIAPRFSLHTSINGYGPVTRINSIQQNQQLDSTEPSSSSQPNESTSNEVGLVEWRSSAIGRTKTIVKMIGNNRAITLGTLMKSNSLGSKRLFGGLGGPDIKWTETDGTWQCTPARETRLLAVLHSRIATRGTRIEISTEGSTQLDTIVLTALLVLHGEGDWKAFQHRRVVPSSPYTLSQPRPLMIVPTPHVTALTLTLSTNSFLNGLLAVGGQLMYGMRTDGNRTSISKYTWEDRPRLEEFAAIDWQDSSFFGKTKSMVTYKGQRRCTEEFMYSHFLGNRMRRFGQPDFLPWMQWIENPPAWTCYSHPGRMPLAILDRRFMTAGTRLDVTFDGLEYLDALVISTILIVHNPHDWRRPSNLRRGLTDQAVGARGLGGPVGRRSLLNLRRAAGGAGGGTGDENGPPGLPRRASESRISRISGDSEIPGYSPPPVGLPLDYAEAGYINPRSNMTPLASAAASMTNLDLIAAASAASRAQLQAVSSPLAAVVPVTSADPQTNDDDADGPPPPSYHPPTYSESHRAGDIVV